MEGVNNMNASDIAFDLQTWALIYFIETGDRIKAGKLQRLAKKYALISDGKIKVKQ